MTGPPPGYGYPSGPASGHAAPQGFSSGPGGGSNYVPPPPPPTGGEPPPVHGSGGFGSERRKIWRNVIIAVVALILGGWFVLWLLGALAAKLVDWVPTDVDVSLGQENWQELAPESARCTDPGPLAYVEELAQPLVEASGSEFEFQFTVVDDEQINAFALPGGFVTVNMGLLEAAQTGEEVAAVIAHEMAHVTERHGMRAVLRRVGGVALVSLVFGGSSLETIAWAAEGLSTQAHSRDQERDADDVGRRILMDAGVDPTGMATFFERLEAESVEIPELISTHPDPGERAATAREIAAGFTPTRKLPDPPADLKCR